MLRKEKPGQLSASNNITIRPSRRSFPGSTAPTIASIASADSQSTDKPRRKKSSDKRKVSRVHLGRLQFLAEDCVDDDPDPNKPIQPYDFFMAASSGKIKTVSKYLEDGGDVNVVDSCNRSALHRASLYEQAAIVSLLIDRGANVNLADQLCNTPLHWACRGNSLEVVQTLVANKAKVNKKDQLQNTPLHVATRVGFLDCVNYLLECGARINEKDYEGDTPIHDAIRLARPKVVRTLILHGANMSIKNMNSKTASDMLQAWYNSTKEAILDAEKERKRKGLDSEKLDQETEKREKDQTGCVNVKKFSIESYESWKEDLMKCGGENPAIGKKSSNETLFKNSSVFGSVKSPKEMQLLALPEEDQDMQPGTSFSMTPDKKPLSGEDSTALENKERITRCDF